MDERHEINICKEEQKIQRQGLRNAQTYRQQPTRWKSEKRQKEGKSRE